MSPKRSARETNRMKLLEAGWQLLDELTLEDSLASMTAVRVSDLADVSERTFWNHFETFDAFVQALVNDVPPRGRDASAEDDYEPVDSVGTILDGVDRRALASLIFAAANANWHAVSATEDLRSFRRQLLVASRTGSDENVSELLAQSCYETYLPELTALYEAAGEAAGVVPIQPLTVSQFARCLAALSEGFLIQRLAGSEEVTSEVVSTATTMLALSILTSAERPETCETKMALFALDDGPIGPMEEPDVRVAMEAYRQYVKREGRAPSWDELRELTGQPVSELVARFRIPDLVLAVGWAHHLLEELEPEGDRELDPQDSAALYLRSLVRSARENHEEAHCLLTLGTRSTADRMMLESINPLGRRLADTLRAEYRPSHMRMTNVALAAALSDHSSSPAHVAALALSA